MNWIPATQLPPYRKKVLVWWVRRAEIQLKDHSIYHNHLPQDLYDYGIGELFGRVIFKKNGEKRIVPTWTYPNVLFWKELDPPPLGESIEPLENSKDEVYEIEEPFIDE